MSPNLQEVSSFEATISSSRGVSPSPHSSAQLKSPPQGTTLREKSRPPGKKKNLAVPDIVQYPNGTVRHQWMDGHAATNFPNGDIKQEFPSGKNSSFLSFAEK